MRKVFANEYFRLSWLGDAVECSVSRCRHTDAGWTGLLDGCEGLPWVEELALPPCTRVTAVAPMFCQQGLQRGVDRTRLVGIVCNLCTIPVLFQNVLLLLANILAYCIRINGGILEPTTSRTMLENENNQ